MFGRRGLESDPGSQDRLRGLNGRPDMATPPAPPNALSPKPAPAMAPAMAQPAASAVPPPASTPSAASPIPTPATGSPQPTISVRNASITDAAPRIYPLAIQRIDTEVAAKLERDELARQLTDVVGEIIVELKLQLNHAEQRELVTLLLDDMLGLGPLEPLLADERITDIMVNGPKQVYVERKGKLELTDVSLPRQRACDDVATAHRHARRPAHRRILAAGRRTPAGRQPRQHHRSAAGDRRPVDLDPQILQEDDHARRRWRARRTSRRRWRRCSRSRRAARLNILISGGTGSGKTTLLNAMSQMIDPTERIVTIEDAAELQLQQPHVVRLETRPPNLEGRGEITMRDLVKNALRMRPDRIILGEIRGAEALDMLQAMNTGHDGSLCTIHANRPREALTRLENMVGMAGINLPAKAVRQQIAAAVHLIVQVSRMRDGIRRVTPSPKSSAWKATSSRRRSSLPTSMKASCRTGA